MNPWVQALLALCAVALTAALLPALLALGRAARRSDNVLAIVEQELRPLVARIHALLEDLRELTRETRGEVARAGVVTERVGEIADALGRLAAALTGLTRAGQLVGVVAGIKKGIDVFVHRFRREQGDHHE